MPRRTWTDDDLRAAVAGARNLHQVFTALGLRVGGGAWTAMKSHIVRLELDTDHWDPAATQPYAERRQTPLPRWSDEQVLGAATGARSVAQMMDRLGLDPNRRRGRASVTRRLQVLGIDPSKLDGQAWSRGLQVARPRRPLEEILVRGIELTTSDLRRRLLDEGVLQPRCVSCGLDMWLGRPIPLQLDHVDGDRTNNLLENLRVLCPTCHALTDTYCGRNIGRR